MPGADRSAAGAETGFRKDLVGGGEAWLVGREDIGAYECGGWT
jgi:hypothetical protein